MCLLNVTSIKDKAALQWTRWISSPTSWEISRESKSQISVRKATLSHFTRRGQILILSSLARCSTINSEGVGPYLITKVAPCPQLKALWSWQLMKDYAEHWEAGTQTSLTALNSKTPLQNRAGETKLLLSLMLNIRSCSGSCHFKVYVSA